MAQLLSINNLEISIADANEKMSLVRNINLTIGEGETIGIAGESGSGKSITALSVMKLLPPALEISSGSIDLHLPAGKTNMRALNDEEMCKIRGKHIGMIFQEPMTSLNPAMRCGKQVTEIIRLHQHVNSKEAREHVFSLFEEVKLPDIIKTYQKYPHELSGGQRQRVMIAMAVACNPKILIADEPTTALDVTVQKNILELLARLKEKYNMSMLLISHDLGILASIADRIALMYKGEMVEEGNARQVLQKPSHAYTRALLACRPDNKHYTEVPVLPTVDTELSSITGKEQQETVKREMLKPQSSVILQVKDLQTAFIIKRNLLGKPTEEFFAVNNANFEVYENETLGIVGGSGSGKTTLGRTILSLVNARKGEIYYRDKSILNLNSYEEKKIRRKIQIIFQDPYSSLNPRIKIGNALMEAMQVHGIHKNANTRQAEARYLLEIVGLPKEAFGKYPHEFSGGQRQRIGIARALAVKPELIICDEMVSALDVSVQAQVLNLLNQLKSEFGLTYLFISHDLAVVKYMADRLIVMDKGQIVEMGNATSIMDNPQHPYTKTLIQSLTTI